jgi:hypothetical protein
VPNVSPYLIRSREEVVKDLRSQASKGRTIRDTQYDSDEVDDAEDKERKWNEYNLELLKRSFSDASIAGEYSGIFWTYPDRDTAWSKLNAHEARMARRISFLESLLQRMKLIPEFDNGPPVIISPRVSHPPSNGKKVFIIHGHDKGATDAVTLFVRNLGLSAIILQNKPNEGMTLDSKLEAYSHVDFAITILTPDDSGNPRPNVALEWGWFRRTIGKERVCILYKDGTIIPSDMSGVGRILMDPHDGWQQKVAREIKAVRIEIDPEWYVKS